MEKKHFPFTVFSYRGNKFTLFFFVPSFGLISKKEILDFCPSTTGYRSDIIMVPFRKIRHSKGWMVLLSTQLLPTEKNQVWGRVGRVGHSESRVPSWRGYSWQSAPSLVSFCLKAGLSSETCVKVLSELTAMFLDLKQVLTSQKILASWRW